MRRFPRPTGPITGPAAWYGRDMKDDDRWIYRLSDSDIDEVDAALLAFRESGVALADITHEAFPLPTLGPRLRSLLNEIVNGRGFILMRGLPVHRYTREETAAAYMGMGRYLGKFRTQNAKGHLLGHVKDLGLKISDPTVRYYQTSRRLEYHTDSVDIVGLLCLNTAKSGGESFVVSSVTLHNEILKRRPDLLPALFEPCATDRRSEVPDGLKPWFELPIFNWYEGLLSTIYTRQYIESAQERFSEVDRLSPQQIEAMDLLDELCNDPEVHLSMAFLPGDMQFLHNHQTLHSRNDFENWPEPERHRHLLRLWLAPKEGRPLPEIFLDRYRSLTQGERGGISVKGTIPKVPLEAE